MALDRQRILNELGSVMNQLKSADCGCMGKLFGQPGQTASLSPLPTCGGCRRNCCRGHGHGWNASGSCGEPYQASQSTTCSPCMGRCNPPKLYSDTYNYLTDSLMQPTIQEVYNDLKSLTPDNTIANSPMANQMGLTPNSLAAQGNIANMSNNMNPGNTKTGSSNLNIDAGNMGNDYNNFNNQPANAASMPTNAANPNQMDMMGGMGPRIMNMLGGNMTSQNKTNPGMGQTGQLTGPMLIDAPQSPHGQVGVTPLSATIRNNQDVYNAQGFPSDYNANQGMMQSNTQPGVPSQNTGNGNPVTLQMTDHFGHHSKGIAKFNDMFPGVMKNDLGFDPMDIAIQMNPANQQQAAINSMSKMMHNNDINKVFDTASPATLAGSSLNQVQQSMPLQQIENEVKTGQPNATLMNQMAIQNAPNYNKSVNENTNVYGNTVAQLNKQQVYTAGMPVPNQQINQAEQQQRIIDPNRAREMAPPTLYSAYEGSPYQQPMLPESSGSRRIIKEPILPADTSRYIAPKQQKYFEFNTLGQPVEKTSAEIYRTPVPSLPQTLSPQLPPKQTVDASKYSNVKSTMSKTSLMGKAVGKTPSQLQHIYNQYKGSQSFTQQNIPAERAYSNNPGSLSEAKINAHQISQQQRSMPVERVGGDTVANNQMLDKRTAKVEQVMGQIGDVPAAVTPISDEKANEMVPILNRKTRNGLQDMVYTSYPSSSAWTFHGGSPRPYSPIRGRYRSRY